jgi:RND family efflux transporter MFP subunit
LLLELDTSDYRLAVQQAEANLAAAKAHKVQADARLKRAQALGTNQYISADDLLARETDVMVLAAQIRVQEASLAIAQRNLEKCEIRAPFNGYVSERKAQLGAWVNPGSPLLVLTQTDRFELDAEIPDELSASLLQADSMQFVSRNESWQVRLLRMSPGLEMERRSRRARFEFLAEAPPVGRSGEIVWRVNKGLLPANLMVRRNGVLGVFLNQSNTADFRPLPGAQEGRPVAVSLPVEAEIVVLGRDRLQDGDAIIPNRKLAH